MTHRKTEKERELADKRGGREGWGRSQIKRRREILDSINYSILPGFVLSNNGLPQPLA
jgi:hypothetical protein